MKMIDDIGFLVLLIFVRKEAFGAITRFFDNNPSQRFLLVEQAEISVHVVSA
jgi:hypothetical protein